MPAQKPREIAIHVLRRHEENLRFLDAILDHELTAAQLLGPDRGLVQELTYGVVRWQSTLDWLIARKADQPPRKGVVRNILRLGLYQLFWLDRVPDHAAVNETVELTRHFGVHAQAGFVNAILRDYTRDRDATRRLLEALKQSDPAVGYSHPSWLLQKWSAVWGPEVTARLLEWNNTPATLYARRNTLQGTQADLEAAWKKEGVEFQPRSFDWVEPGLVYEFRSPTALLALKSFQQGWFYVQDPSTLLAVRLLDPRPGESILDFCAAPGGKTTYTAQLMNNQGYIMAQDLDIHRRNAIKQNCTRLGVSIVSISRATTAVNLDLSEPFDKVLVDAPCTNTGVIRRRVDLRWRIQPDAIERLSDNQRAILRQAAPQVKPQGLLVYSTCSLEMEENQTLVRSFLEANPSFHLEAERQLLPWIDGVDGAYVAVLRRGTA